MRMLIPGLPVDDAANRAWATRLGQDWHLWPVPAAGSVPMRCENCGGAVLVDPESEGIRQRAKGGRGRLRLLASRISMLAAQMSPSTVKGTRRAVAPVSPCERTSS